MKSKYEVRAERDRKATLRFSLMLWSVGVAAVIAVVAILGAQQSMPEHFWTIAAGVGVVLLLVIRRLGKRLGGTSAAKPDPQSTIKLN